jgi:dienelactone hydrolase
VVESLSHVINHYLESNPVQHVVLIGHSGGGVLAVLVAPHVPATAAVVTLAANLDVAAWTQWHGYLPLTDSLSPATQPPLPATILQLHLTGGRDRNVPESINAGYLKNVPPADVWRFPRFDHSCCWVKRWPELLARIDARLGWAGTAPAERAPATGTPAPSP